MLKYHGQMTELQDRCNTINVVPTNTILLNWILMTMGFLHSILYKFKLSEHNKN